MNTNAILLTTYPIHPILLGLPVTALRLSTPDDLVRWQAEIRSEWQRWDILEKLLHKGSC